MGAEEPNVAIASDEKTLLEFFWQLAADHKYELVGFNITGFDLPFLFRRSWKLGIKPPSIIRRGRYWADSIIDLMELWAFFRQEQRESLNTICRALGFGEKSGSGKDFAELWANDREKAVEYCKNDLRLTKSLYEKLCK
jgi:DNA polymerase elongation subunit (family B)